jgi:metal-dependent HD superfamily phosphatase/phosphodiesterase
MSESLIIEEGKTPLPPIESESIETVSTFAGGKKPVEIPIITTSKAEDLFVDVPAWKKVTAADIKKSVKNEVNKELVNDNGACRRQYGGRHHYR